MVRLPPLNALRAFEASARHLSFTRAADALHTQKAYLSRVVTQLEKELGARLLPAHGWFEGLPGLALDGVRREAMERARDTGRIQ